MKLVLKVPILFLHFYSLLCHCPGPKVHPPYLCQIPCNCNYTWKCWSVRGGVPLITKCSACHLRKMKHPQTWWVICNHPLSVLYSFLCGCLWHARSCALTLTSGTCSWADTHLLQWKEGLLPPENYFNKQGVQSVKPNQVLPHEREKQSAVMAYQCLF